MPEPLTHLLKPQNTQLNAETKSQDANVIFLEIGVIFTVSSFLDNPVYII